jgi:glycosyltransferase involved in cell wall biosynthesis
MLSILATHPIQYQVPLWQALARDGRVPFEVWYLTDHGAKPSHDREFGKSFAWDLDMLSGYPHQFLDVVSGARPSSFWACRLKERLRDRMRSSSTRALWIQGWQVAAYWQAVREARKAGADVWVRGESNDLASPSMLTNGVKRLLLAQLFSRINRFLYIGAANRRLYQTYGVPDHRLYAAPYAVDNQRFVKQAAALSEARMAIRQEWQIADDAFCVLFCGKFIPKKHPLDVAAAARFLIASGRLPMIHLLFVGSGELDTQLRAACDVVFDAENPHPVGRPSDGRPKASFAGFLNQTEISKAYVAADCLVLPSDPGETWGLVVNEAIASGLPCIISDACGSAEDVSAVIRHNPIFRCGDPVDLAHAVMTLCDNRPTTAALREFSDRHSIAETVRAVHSCYVATSSGM